MFILLLTGCSKKILPTPVGELKALDNFWKVLGGEKSVKEVKSDSEKQ